MYHFGSHETFPSQGGGAAAFGDPSLAAAAMNYSDMVFLGGSSSSSNNLEEKLKLLRFSHGTEVLHQATHNSSMGGGGGADEVNDLRNQFELENKQEFTSHLMQASSYQQCFDLSNASEALGMLNAASFHSPAATIMFGEMPSAEINSTIFYDAGMSMDLSNQPSVLRNMLSSLENGSGLINHGRDSFINGFDEGYGGHTEIKQAGGVKRKKRGQREDLDEAGSQKNEKQRRERFTKKFDYLRSLIPNTTKPDRASVIADTIDYINELLRTIKELKILVEKKRLKMARGTNRLVAGEHEVEGDTESSSMIPLTDDADRALKGLMLRSSWLQRRTKETFVDVRIVEDEVYIKVTQRRRINCLLLLSKVLDELHLELLHLSGGNIGDTHIFMLDTKIHEGSSVYASAVAKKLIEVMDVSCPSF